MATLNPHPDVYGSGELAFVAVLDQPPREQTIDSVPNFARNLATLAAEIEWPVLWVIETTAMIALLVIAALMVEIRDWRGFVALGMALAYFTISAVTGGYLILIKNNTQGDRQ